VLLTRQAVGLVLGERSVVAVEVARAGGAFEVVRSVELGFPESISWDDPAGLGAHLGQALRDEHMHPAGAVGLPARWLATARHDVPPVPRQTLIGLLRLAVDGAFSLGPNRVVCDYASAPPDSEAGTVLLVGALRERVASLSQVLQAARFRPRAVTSTVGALAAASEADGRLTVLVGPEAVEVARLDSSGLTALRHLPASTIGGDHAAAARALRLAASSMLGTGEGGVHMALWDGGADNAFREACAEHGIDVAVPPPLAVRGISKAAEATGLTEARIAAGAALAVAALEPRRLPFDLLHSHLAAEAPHRWRRPAMWAACILLAVLLAALLFAADARSRKESIAELTATLADQAPAIEAARSVVESVEAARAWYDRRPPFLDCLHALTLAFPEDERVWTTSLAVRDSMEGALTGKATDEEPVLDVLDAMRNSGEFANVKLLYVQETRGAAREHTFSITFAYTGAD
jgi:hypothetical protein